MRNLAGMAIAVAVVSIVVTSCGSLSINAVPLPGSNYQGGYVLTAEFNNVLNLPDRAKVVMDGTAIGVVTDVSVAGEHVDVKALIDRDVEVPSNIRAELQQATVLGDIYVALERDEDMPAAPPLSPGGLIPLAQTVSPPQIEDTIAHLANFVGSGSIQRAQNTLIGINRVTPAKDEERRVVSQVTTDLADLSNNIDNVDLLINGLHETSAVLAARTPALSLWFSPEGVNGFDRAMVLGSYFSRILPSLGTIYNYGAWVVPLFTSLANAMEAVQGSKQAVEAEYPLYRRFITEYFMPQDKYPAINITSIVGPDGREMSGDVEQVLRMLGATP